VRAGVAKMVT